MASKLIRVGLFVTVALAALGYFVLRIEDWNLFPGDTQVVEAAFDSVAGLDDKAAVRVAGVRVGRVDGIRLEGEKAYVRLLLETPVELWLGSEAAITNMGLLGDKYVELRPGDPNTGLLPEGTVLPGRTPAGWDEAMARLDSLGESLQSTLASFDPQETGPALKRLAETLEETADQIRQLVIANEARVSATLTSVERFSASLAEDVPRLTQRLDEVLALTQEVLAENRGSLNQGMTELAETSVALRGSVDNLHEITSGLAAGEGTLGKLLSSDETHNQLLAALESVETGVEGLSDAVGRIRTLELDVGIDGYYLDELEEARTSFSLTLSPPTDRFYYLALVDDPRGRIRKRSKTTTITGPDGVVETTLEEELTRKDEPTYSAQVGFKLGKAQFRTGLFESSGGAGVDYQLFDRRLAVSFDAFDFGRPDDLDPHLRLTTRWNVHPNIYLLGGYDDFLEDEYESLFLGAGIHWSDDDLKYLLGAVR